MNIVIAELDEINLEHVNRCDGTFTVESKLRLHTEGGEITYTVVDVSKYEKRYPDQDIDYAAYVRQPDWVIFLAYVEDEVVGRIILRKNWNRYGYIDDVVVDAKYRKRGIGSKLLDQAIEWARAKGLPGLMLETQNNNLAACRFYERAGFRLGGFDTQLYRGLNNQTDEIALYWYLLF